MSGRSRSGLDTALLVALEFRLGAICLTALSLPSIGRGKHVTAALLVMAAMASFMLIIWWDRWGKSLVRHPLVLAAEIPVAGVILVYAGPASPFVYFSLFTAFFGGLLYGRVGAAGLTAALLGTYGASLALRSAHVAEVGGFQDLVSIPALLPLAGLAGVVLRELFARAAETDHALQLAVADAAAERERGRLARNLHDSLAKSLQGIAMSAEALAVTVGRAPDKAATMARRLADGAQTASGEARSILVDLRATVDLESSLDVALTAEVAGWSARSGTPAVVAADPVGRVDPRSAQELLLVTRETLRNVDRHAGASTVSVSLVVDGANLVLSIQDDGAGFRWSGVVTERQFVGHFGLVGMRERMESVGGELRIDSQQGLGTTVCASMPTTPPASPRGHGPVRSLSLPTTRSHHSRDEEVLLR